VCGIFGYIGGENSYGEVKSGLERLSYRGYDSAGIASVSSGSFQILKCTGHPEDLEDSNVLSGLSIGHNRWATHGTPSLKNAHPHVSNDGKIALVHNGIVENYSEIKNLLISNGFELYSDTDTELIPNLIQHFFNECGDISIATTSAMSHIRGAYAIVFLHLDYPEQINIARLGSPVCIGRSKQGEYYISSDENSLSMNVDDVMIIDDNKFATISKEGGVKIRNLNGENVPAIFREANINHGNYSLGEHGSYLEKEIFEQPIYIRNALAGRVNGLDTSIRLGGVSEHISEICNADEIIFTGCGSAYYAACIGAYAMEGLARKRTRVLPAGELKYNNVVMDDKTVLISVSQSGETADTIGCIKNAKNHNVSLLGVVNTPNSTISRMVDAGIYIRAGNEISVASTKAVLNQIVAMISLAAVVASQRDYSPLSYEGLINELLKAPTSIENILSISGDIEKISKKYSKYNSMICIGRGALTPIAMEAALKIKEISYIHAEGYSAAELKHGPLALICEDVPTIAFVDAGVIEEKMLSNIREIKSRGGRVLGVVSDACSQEVMDSVDDLIVVPNCSYKVLSPINFLIPAQLLSYYLARNRGLPIDRPRNLAKSVTVE